MTSQKHRCAILLAVLGPLGATVAGAGGEPSAADRGIEQFLREAEVVVNEPVGEGITKPRKLTLRRGDQARQ